MYRFDTTWITAGGQLTHITGLIEFRNTQKNNHNNTKNIETFQFVEVHVISHNFPKVSSSLFGFCSESRGVRVAAKLVGEQGPRCKLYILVGHYEGSRPDVSMPKTMANQPPPNVLPQK